MDKPSIEFSEIEDGGRCEIPDYIWEKLELNEGEYLMWRIHKDNTISVDRCAPNTIPIKRDLFGKIEVMATEEHITPDEVVMKILDEFFGNN